MGVTQDTINMFFAGPPKKKRTVDGETKAEPPRKAIKMDVDEAPKEPEESREAREAREAEEAEEVKEATEAAEHIVETQLTKGEPIRYKALCDTFEKIEQTTKRLEINAMLTEFYLGVLRTNPNDLAKVTYLCINRLGPDYEGLELGLGESLIMKALAEATGRTLAQVKADYKESGDLGLVAIKSRSKQPTMFQPKPLDINAVFANLTEIAKATGQASQNRKIGIIKKTLTAAKGSEAKFLVRSLEGKLRIGVAEKSVLTSLAQAFVQWEAEKAGKKKPSAEEVGKAEELLRDVHCQLPNYELIIVALLEHGLEGLREACKLTPGVPLKPMLAKPTKSITEVLDRFSGEKFTCEYKYDGERAQVHMTEDGQFRVYSRNSEDMSQRYPDIVSIAPKLAQTKGVTSFILDCEAVAWDRQQQKILPFQVLSTRKRKDVEEGSIVVRVCLFAFDILYLNGEPLIQKSLAERRAILGDYFGEVPGEFTFAKSMNTDSIEEIQHFLDQSIKDGCEGLMIKVLEGEESGYEPSKRSRNWLKLKKDYLSGLGDSLDLVVLGAYYGKGKRTSTYGVFLLGCYNEDTEEFESICKIGTGFSDANLELFYNELKETVIPEKKSYVSHDSAPNHQPDVWFEPKYVWEVLTADLSLSPVYRAGINELGKGVSLRFPRFIRVREDKAPEDATNAEQVVEFYQRQVHQQ
ncbi:DNA ligase 1 [Trichomonascus vanleenenianus]|uniref:DNA ligase (ATP) CDC9 n=1 Tax=Trichomonascus vanleenenianus TaxID=2268995 RepID=UPI003EC9D9C2